MKTFDIQGIEIGVPAPAAFWFVADPDRLPDWTSAFASVTPEGAVMRTPSGETEVELDVLASPEHGTIDWRMTFPDGNVATAFSRVVEIEPDRCVYGFILTPPPVPLELLEGTLAEQSKTLGAELKRLKSLLEQDG